MTVIKAKRDGVNAPRELDLFELHQGLRIDQDDLDNEMIDQPEIFYRISHAHAEAVAQRDSLKVDIEQAEAELYQQFRKKAEENDEKITDTAIKREVETSVRYTKLVRAHLAAKTKADKLYAMKESYEMRGKMLQHLTTLYSANYWTRESGGKRLSEVKQEKADRIRQEAGRLRRERRNKDADT